MTGWNLKMSNVVKHESDNGISTITLNRPDKMNALNEELIIKLQQSLKKFQQSDDRVAIYDANDLHIVWLTPR